MLNNIFLCQKYKQICYGKFTAALTTFGVNSSNIYSLRIFNILVYDYLKTIITEVNIFYSIIK